MTSLVEHYSYLAVLAVVGLESLGIPLPGETVLITAALYAGATHNLQIAWIIVAASAGAILGDNTGYLLGHWGGYRLLVRFGRYVRLEQPRVKLARYLFLRFGGQVVFFGRFVSVLRTYAAFLAGTTRMPWRRFIAFNAAGGILWAMLYGTAAYFLGKEIDRLSRPLAISFAVAAVLVIGIAALVVRLNVSRLEANAERELPGPLQGYPGGPPL